MISKLTTLWNKIPPSFKHVVHTAWQVALPVTLVHLYAAHTSKDVQAALIAGGAVFLASLKASIIKV